jgi:hypothetical protein
MDKDKDMEFKYGLITLNMWASGKITRQMEEGFSFTQTETNMMVNGLMIRLVDLVLTRIVTELSTLESGRKINSGAEENRFGLTDKSMKDSTKEALKMV